MFRDREMRKPSPGAVVPENGSQAITECSIKSCARPALRFIGIPYCQKHMEVDLLVTMAHRRNWTPSLLTIACIMIVTDVDWQVGQRELPRILADILIHRKRQNV